jgi:hypothetical protein
VNDHYDPDLLKTVAVAEFSRQGACVVLFKSKINSKLSYGYRCYYNTGWDGKWYITDINDSVVLPPYEKHVYPSYPNTNKKLGRPVKKMKLHNHIPEVPEGLEYQQIQAWKEDRYIM